jgi:methylated-DNA-protein-cysteine methyltransferase-like protein
MSLFIYLNFLIRYRTEIFLISNPLPFTLPLNNPNSSGVIISKKIINTLTYQERICFVVDLIPYGKVSSYGVIADLAGLPRRARFVSTALRKAPKNREMPWYRVLNAQGRLSIPNSNPLYQIQWALLEAEGVFVQKGKVDMRVFGWQPDLDELLFSLPF